MAAAAAGLGGGAGTSWPVPVGVEQAEEAFLRKPNVAEAGEQFGQLGRELRAQECLPYAAWCQLAVARCQQALFHGPGEALALTEAARLFLRQERDARQRLVCPAAYGSRCRPPPAPWAPPCACTSSWASGRRRCPLPGAGRRSARPGSAGRRRRPLPARRQLQLPSCRWPRCRLRRVRLLPAAGARLQGALAVFTRMQRLAREHGGHPVQLRRHRRGPPGPARHPPCRPRCSLRTPLYGSFSRNPGRLLRRAGPCEVSRVLLLLLLQPPPHAQTLEKYSWEAFDSHGQESSGQLPEELFLLLQSLVMATHEKDTEAIKSLQVDLWPLLTAEQNHLLHLVLQEAISPSGQGI
uniref:Factor VIII intron 22 protein n=1 Tax=Microcebus murinus TaxID=30608 RepID=A0A8C5YDW0_MICMU